MEKATAAAADEKKSKVVGSNKSAFTSKLALHESSIIGACDVLSKRAYIINMRIYA